MKFEMNRRDCGGRQGTTVGLVSTHAHSWHWVGKQQAAMPMPVHDLHSKWKQKINAKFDWSHHMRRIRNVLGHCNVQPTVR